MRRRTLLRAALLAVAVFSPTVSATTITESAGAASASGGNNNSYYDNEILHSSDPSSPPPPSPPLDDNNAVRAMDTQRTRGLTALLVFGGVAAAFIVALVGLYSNLKRTDHSVASDDEGDDTDDSSDRTGYGMLPWWADDELLLHRLRFSDIHDQRVISATSSRVVYLVQYKGATKPLISKRLHLAQQQHEDYQHMRCRQLNELFIQAKLALRLSHPSIVQFVGVAWTNKIDLQVLFEYMPHGNLRQYLSTTTPTPVTGAAMATTAWQSPSVKLRLAIDIVEALVYTHSFYPPLVHRNLQPQNILLTSTSANSGDVKAKLSGFGCARLESENDSMTRVTSGSVVGNERWLAPEVLSGSTSYGTASDMYAFGVVLCEMDTHRVPYSEADTAGAEEESSLLQRVARGELRPQVSTSCPLGMKEIVDACLAFDAAQRPSAIQVAYLLRSLLLLPADQQCETSNQYY